MTKKNKWQTMFLAILAAMACVFAPASRAEKPVASKLDSSEARDFIGNWAVAVDMQQRKVNLGLKVVDLAGKVGATIDSEQLPEPTAIENISKNERGHLILKYPMKFGQQEFKITIDAEPASSGLEGTFSEDSGLFKAQFTAKTSTDDPEAAQARGRNRRNAAASGARLRFGDDKVNITFHPLAKGSEDYKRLEALKDGEVFSFVGGRATKLMTDVNMKFAQVVVKKENAAPNYPGVYSLWLRKNADGWSLVFNNEADIWGTMYNKEANAAEIKLDVGTAAAPSDTFKVVLDEAEKGGVLKLIWGDKQWSAPFEVEGFVRKPVAAAAAPAAPAPGQTAEKK